MSAVIHNSLMTLEEFEALADEFPRELVRGKVIEMPPPRVIHGHVCGNVAYVLESWARPIDIGIVTANDSAVVTERNPDSVRGCDVAFTRWEKLPGRTLPMGPFRESPDLVVEVISPSERWRGIVANIGEYLDAGVREVWVVDPADRTVEVFRNDCKSIRLSNDEVLTSPEVLPEFACRIREFFRHV